MARFNILSEIVSFMGTASGGSWLAGLPLTNLQDQEPKKIARSTNAAVPSTAFVIDLGHPSPVSLFALINHNLSSSATIRWRLSNASDLSAPLIDVMTNANEPNVVWGSLPWGAFPWQGFLADEQPGGPSTYYKNSSTQFGQYIGVDINDTTNPAGRIDIGVFVSGDPFVPTINIAYGAGLGLVDPSKQTRADGGALFTDLRPKYRTFSANLEFLTQGEAIGAVYRMRRNLGISGSLLMIIDPDDTDGALAAGTIYGRLSRVDDPIQIARIATDYVYSATIEVEELI